MFIKSVIDDRGLSGKVTFVAANDMGSGEELFVLSAGEVSRLPFPLDEGSEVDENIYDTLKAAFSRSSSDMLRVKKRLKRRISGARNTWKTCPISRASLTERRRFALFCRKSTPCTSRQTE